MNVWVGRSKPRTQDLVVKMMGKKTMNGGEDEKKSKIGTMGDGGPDVGTMVQGYEGAPLTSHPRLRLPRFWNFAPDTALRAKAPSSCHADMTTMDTCGLFRVLEKIGGKRELILVRLQPTSDVSLPLLHQRKQNPLETCCLAFRRIQLHEAAPFLLQLHLFLFSIIT